MPRNVFKPATDQTGTLGTSARRWSAGYFIDLFFGTGNTNLSTALSAKAPLNSPALTGSPTAPTPADGSNDTSIATTAFVASRVTALVNSSPSALDTLRELAAALGDDPSFTTTVTNSLATKVPTSRVISTSGLAGGGGALSADRTIDVPVASQAEAEAGSSNTKAMTPLRTAQAIAALSGGGGGGGAISTPNVVWVMSDGDDDTGDGSLASPFATAQKAYDTVKSYGDAYCIMFGVGSFGGVVCGGYGWRTGLSIRGMGANVSKVGAITSSYLVDLHSDNSVEVASVAISEAYPLTLHSVTLNGSATATGSNGGEGAPGTPGDSETPGGAGGNGSDGQAGPAVKAYDCIIGGELGSHGGAGGAGGAGGSDGGAGAGSDGTPGNPGSEGEVTAVRCRISSISGGSGLLACCAYDSLVGSLTDAGGNATGVVFN